MCKQVLNDEEWTKKFKLEEYFMNKSFANYNII